MQHAKYKYTIQSTDRLLVMSKWIPLCRSPYYLTGVPWKSKYVPVSLGRYALASTELELGLELELGIVLLAAPAKALYGVAPGKNEVGIVGIGMGESVPNAVDRSLGILGAAYPEGVAVAVNVVLYEVTLSPKPDCKQYPDPYALRQL